MSQVARKMRYRMLPTTVANENESASVLRPCPRSEANQRSDESKGPGQAHLAQGQHGVGGKNDEAFKLVGMASRGGRREAHRPPQHELRRVGSVDRGDHEQRRGLSHQLDRKRVGKQLGCNKHRQRRGLSHQLDRKRVGKQLGCNKHSSDIRQTRCEDHVLSSSCLVDGLGIELRDCDQQRDSREQRACHYMQAASSAAARRTAADDGTRTANQPRECTASIEKAQLTGARVRSGSQPARRTRRSPPTRRK